MQQLKAYSSTSKMKEEGIEVVAASVDTEEFAQKTAKECNVTVKANNKFLDTGDMFPRLEMSKIGGGKIVLPNDLLDKWGVVLFYSGHW